MGVSIKWLKKYIDFDLSAEELAHRLTMAGIAIEGVENIGDDQVMELDLTPNRGDCLGMINLAREVAALTGNELSIPAPVIKENQERIEDYIKVELQEPELCKRYAARAVKNVKVKPSPAWMQEALINSGIRPINNVVDITNYVMLETNQPLHAFDYKLLAESRIEVRRAYKGEKFTTLDETERVLDEDMLLICDGQKPVALAGIMGGLNSEIKDDTTIVLLESANFFAPSIRQTSRKLALRSDSSIRFEKIADVNGVIYAINRAAELMQELADGEVIAGIYDVYPHRQENAKISIRPERVNYLLGTQIEPESIKGYLLSLGFAVEEQKEKFVVEVPTYRPDITMEADLIEEIARLYGYENISASLPYGNATRGGFDEYQRFRETVRNICAESLYEVINYSFINPAFLDRLMIPGDSVLRNVVKVANPLSEEQSVMRTLLLPGLLENISKNQARRNSSLNFFEIGSVFYPADGLPEQRLKLGAAVTGTSEMNWLKKQVEHDFFYLKGILEDLLGRININAVSFEAAHIPGFHPGRAASVLAGGQEIGIIGELHPRVLANFDLKDRACVFEIDIDLLFQLKGQRVMTESITRYPGVERDIAVLLKEEVKAARAVEVIETSDRELLRDVVVFDIYKGKQVPAGFKSMAFRLKLQSDERTLTEEDVNQVVHKLLKNLQEQVGAVLR